MSYHKSTNIGIEIEICVEKKFYKSLKTSSKKNNSLNIYKYPSDEDPFRNNSNGGDSSNDSLNNIVLTTDSTCKCDNKIYTRAEINSPRMKPKHIPHFMDFLENKLFVDRGQIKQGATCGIHIHWSNKELCLHPKNDDYNFEFLKIMFFLRKYISHKVVATQFSGRKHFYDVVENQIKIIINPNIKDIFIINKDFDIKLEKDITLEELKYNLENKEIESYTWNKDLITTNDKINRFFSILEKDEIEICALITLYLNYNSKNILKNTKYMEPIKTAHDMPHEELLDYFNNTDFDYNEIVLELKIILTEIFKRINIRDGWKNYKPYANLFQINSGYMDKFIDLMKNKIGRDKYNIFFDIIKKIMLLQNLTLVDTINYNLYPYRYKNYIPFINKLLEKKLIKYKDTNPFPENKDLLQALMENFKKTPISVYNLKDFHMEFRVFSLDKLFDTHGANITGKIIVEELNNFLELTNTFMTNILNRFNKMYKPDMTPKAKKLYYEFFLMDKEYKPSNNIVKKKMRELFGLQKTHVSSLKRLPLSKSRSRSRSRSSRTKTVRRNSSSIGN